MQNQKSESVAVGADSIIYMLSVDSISIPVKLTEMGDFPVYGKDAPYHLTTPAISVNFKDTKYLHFLNGQMIEGRKRDKVLRKLREENIESVEVMPADQAIEEYGQKAANGVIFIKTRK